MPKILKTDKRTVKNHSKITIYMFSALKGLVLFLIGLLITSLLIIKNSSNDGIIFYIFSFVLMALGGFVSGFSAHKKLKGRGFINGVIAASIYLLVLFIIIIISMKFQVGTNILLIAPICLVSGFLGGMVSANT